MERTDLQHSSKHPAEPHWLRLDARGLPVGLDVGTLDVSIWQRGPLRVISTVDLAKYPTGDDVGPQWHLSVAVVGAARRPSAVEMLRVRRAFGMLAAEEDNHHPGNARHLFMSIDPAHRVDCECKADEMTVREFDGYEWTNPIDGPCRGCEVEQIFKRPCPLHGARKEPRL